jgi:hypothetical protein
MSVGRYRGSRCHVVLQRHRDHQGLPGLVRTHQDGGRRTGTTTRHQGLPPGRRRKVQRQDKSGRDRVHPSGRP